MAADVQRMVELLAQVQVAVLCRPADEPAVRAAVEAGGACGHVRVVTSAAVPPGRLFQLPGHLARLEAHDGARSRLARTAQSRRPDSVTGGAR